MQNLININLYGDGSNNAKLRAEAIYCDRCEECSLYKRGLCARVTSLFSHLCPIGDSHSYGYYTKRSKKFEELRHEVKNHEKYNNLKYPNGFTIEKVGNDILLKLDYVIIRYDEVSGITMDLALTGANIVAIPSDKLTNDMILKICKYRPHRFFDYTEITDYKDKVIPDFLLGLKEKFEDIYNRFVTEYPEYKSVEPNYIGKRAKLNSVNKEVKYVSNLSYANSFRIEGNKIVIEDYNSAFLPFNAKHARVEFEITDDMVIEITDNNQVTKDTIFV